MFDRPDPPGPTALLFDAALEARPSLGDLLHPVLASVFSSCSDTGTTHFFGCERSAAASSLARLRCPVVERPSLALTLTPSVGHAHRSTATVCCRDHRM